MFTFFATKDQLPEPRRKVLVLKRIRSKPLTYAITEARWLGVFWSMEGESDGDYVRDALPFWAYPPANSPDGGTIV